MTDETTEIKTKREQIEELLKEGKTPEEITEIVDCALRYVYNIKAQIVGVKEHIPSTKDHISDIKDHIESMSDDLHTLALQNEIYFILCPACGEFFESGSGELCPDCEVLFCPNGCLSEHKKKEMFSAMSKCQEYQEKIAELLKPRESETETPKKKSFFDSLDDD